MQAHLQIINVKVLTNLCIKISILLLQEMFLAIDLCVCLISIYLIYRFHLTIAYKAVMLVEKTGEVIILWFCILFVIFRKKSVTYIIYL